MQAASGASAIPYRTGMQDRSSAAPRRAAGRSVGDFPVTHAHARIARAYVHGAAAAGQWGPSSTVRALLARAVMEPPPPPPGTQPPLLALRDEERRRARRATAISESLLVAGGWARTPAPPAPQPQPIHAWRRPPPARLPSTCFTTQHLTQHRKQQTARTPRAHRTHRTTI
jgi:hypothetical protein